VFTYDLLLLGKLWSYNPLSTLNRFKNCDCYSVILKKLLNMIRIMYKRTRNLPVMLSYLSLLNAAVWCVSMD